MTRGTPKWFDTTPPYGRSINTDPAAGEYPSGAGMDTYYDDSNVHIRAEQLEVAARLERGEINREEAETILAMLESQQDL